MPFSSSLPVTAMKARAVVSRITVSFSPSSS